MLLLLIAFIALFSTLNQTHCILVVWDSKWLALYGMFLNMH